jgi:hypothetical protein
MRSQTLTHRQLKQTYSVELPVFPGITFLKPSSKDIDKRIRMFRYYFDEIFSANSKYEQVRNDEKLRLFLTKRSRHDRLYSRNVKGQH